VKAAGDGAWEVSGYASVFGVTDLGQDVVEKGAFAQSLAAGQRVRFLYSHQADQVLGSVLSLEEDAHGLKGHWRISKTRLGEDVHTLLKDGALDSFSIGFLPRDFDYDEKAKTRRLKSIELIEVSVVSMPMLPAALVTGVKAADYEALPLERLLEVYDTHRTAALGQAEAVAQRRLSEGRKLSDTALTSLERLRESAEADAALLLRLATTPPSQKDDPAPAEAARFGPVVEAHLRRAQLNAHRRAYGLEPLEWSPP